MRVILIALLAAISYAQTVPVVWRLTRTWTGNEWPNTKSKVDVFYAQESDKFHLECGYARYCEENDRGSTAVQVHNQHGDKVGPGFFCCEQRDINLWDLKAEILNINIVRSADIPIKKTPFKALFSHALSSVSTAANIWGYEKLDKVLDECTEPIRDDIPDLRGVYEDAAGVLIVIEQCGDRFLANGHGVYHDFPHVFKNDTCRDIPPDAPEHACRDIKLEHACRDILPDCICNNDIEDESICHIVVTAEVQEDCIVLKRNGIIDQVRFCNDINGGITREAVPRKIVGHFKPTSQKNPDYTCEHFNEGKEDWSWLDSDGCLAYSNKCPSCDCSCHGEQAWVTNDKTCRINRIHDDVTVDCCSPAESIYSLNPGAWCNEGYSPLTTSPRDCKKAAKSLGYWGDLVAHVGYRYKSSRRPQGCFRSDSDGRFHFNRGAGGNYIGNDMILCIKDTETEVTQQQMAKWLLESLSTPSANGIVKGLALVGFLSVINFILGLSRKYEKTIISLEEEI